MIPSWFDYCSALDIRYFTSVANLIMSFTFSPPHSVLFTQNHFPFLNSAMPNQAQAYVVPPTFQYTCRLTGPLPSLPNYLPPSLPSQKSATSGWALFFLFSWYLPLLLSEPLLPTSRKTCLVVCFPTRL